MLGSLLHSSKLKISVKSVKPFGCTKHSCKLQPPTILCKLNYGYHKDTSKAGLTE